MDLEYLGSDIISKLEKQMYSTAGSDLVDRIIEVMGDEMHALDWFYTRMKGFGYQSAYSLCQKDKKDEVYTLLGKIEDGVLI